MNKRIVAVMAAACLVGMLLTTQPVEAGSPPAPEIDSFTAAWDAGTETVELSWRIRYGNAANLVYVLPDVAWQSQGGTPDPDGYQVNTIAVPVSTAGTKQYTLVVSNDNDPMEFATARSNEVDVPGAESVVVDPSDSLVALDPLELPDPGLTLSWTHSDFSGSSYADGGFVKVTRAGCGLFPYLCVDEVSDATSYTVDTATLAGLGVGRHNYDLTYCRPLLDPGTGQPVVTSYTAPAAGDLDLGPLGTGFLQSLNHGQPVGYYDRLGSITPDGGGNRVDVFASGPGEVVFPGGTPPGSHVEQGEEFIQVRQLRCSTPVTVTLQLGSVAITDVTANAGDTNETSLGSTYRVFVREPGSGPTGENQLVAGGTTRIGFDHPAGTCLPPPSQPPVTPSCNAVIVASDQVPGLESGQWLVGNDLTNGYFEVDNDDIAQPGVYEFRLLHCHFGAQYVATCPGTTNFTAPQAGTATLIEPYPQQAPGVVLADGMLVVQASAQNPIPVVDVDGQQVSVDRPGFAYGVVEDGTQVAQGDQLFSIVEESAFTTIQIVVSAESTPASPWVIEPWTDAFDASTSTFYPSWDREGTGHNLDVTAQEGAGTLDLWSIGEGHESLFHVDDGTPRHYPIPLYIDDEVDPDASSQRLATATPYGFQGLTSVSALAERIVAADDAVWFTEGGALLSSNPNNFSRITRFDPTVQDEPATIDDERFCSIHVPTPNAQVIGLAWDGERIWYGESVGTQTAIGSFVPGDLSCNNLLDYSDPGAVAAAQQYCDSQASPPITTGCIDRYELGGFAGVGHLTLDPSDGSVWFGDYYGGALGHLDSSGNVTRFPLPDVVRETTLTSAWKGNVWQIRVDGDYVYASEFADGDIVRLDKSVTPLSTCESLVDGVNPCVDELHLPMVTSASSVHSIEIHDGDLWFTLTTNGKYEAGSTDGVLLGRIPLSSFDHGTAYNGLVDHAQLTDPTGPGSQQQGPAGIAITSSGAVILADFHRRGIIRLDPLN